MYENVRHESYDLESGGFANLGAGLKYRISDNLNLISEARALKKFDNDDIDIMAGLGIGMMFGAAAAQVAPVSEIEVQQAPIPEIKQSIIPAYAPAVTTTEMEIVQTVPAPSAMYEKLDVVTIDNEGEDSINSRRHKVYAAPRYTDGNSYYIQVAALFKSNGNSTYFKKLDARGLNHEIKHTSVRGRDVKLLLVGPYSSRAEASADLSRAKQVERGAFIKKI
jgi:cell division septation protein DedD